MKTHEPSWDFEPVSAKAWKQKIQADLKGGDYNELLTWRSPEGITVKPFYTAEDLPEGFGGNTSLQPLNWQIGHAAHPDSEEGISLAREALQQGADGLLVAAGAERAGMISGLKPLPGPKWVDVRGIAPHMLKDLQKKADASFEWLLDPIGGLVATGNWQEGMASDFSHLGGGTDDSAGKKTLAIHLSHYQNAGANRIQELAYGLAHLHEYLLRAEEIPGIKPLLEQPVFLVAVGDEYFFEIAKLRALRRLWELLAETAGYSGSCRIFAFPTKRNKTLYDYNTNMLRTTTECMAAVLGGADVVLNFPYDGLYHEPNAFADRIARNQLLLLRHESYFSSVSNPADGTYYIESLTDQLGKKALELFKTLEKGGGFLKQLREHRIQKKIRESARAEQEAFDAGRRVLVGSNKYPNPEDKMKQDLQRDPFPKTRDEKTLIEPILPGRLSESYEQKRLGDE
jgi:methylmalonyl-CoA mutase